MAKQKASPHKRQKYEERLLQEVGVFLRRHVADKRLQFVSVTKVELNSDYSEAILYWDTFDPHKRGDAKAAIQKIAGLFRHHLSGILHVRQVPLIKFRYDAQYDAEQEIDKLLAEELNAKSSDTDED